MYTYIIADLDGSAIADNDIHYMVSNVPGNRLNQGNFVTTRLKKYRALYLEFFFAGDEVFQYFPPFTFTLADDGSLDVTDTKKSNFGAFVYEQTSGPITVPIETDFCGPQIFNRVTVCKKNTIYGS